MGIEDPPFDDPEEAPQQENISSPDIAFDGTDVGRDVHITNDIDQINDGSTEEFPSKRDSVEEGWLTILDVLTRLPISVRGLDLLFGGGGIVGLIVFSLSLSTAIGAADSSLAPWIFQIQIPYASTLLGPAIIMVCLWGLHLTARQNSECPDCGDPIGLRTCSVTVMPAISDYRREYGKRTLECKSCEVKFKERFSRERKNA